MKRWWLDNWPAVAFVGFVVGVIVAVAIMGSQLAEQERRNCHSLLAASRTQRDTMLVAVARRECTAYLFPQAPKG